MAWHVAYEKIEPYLVRIDAEDGFGTGFLLAYNSDHSIAAIATAAHVVNRADSWQKPLNIRHHQSGSTSFIQFNDRVILFDNNRDAATVLVRANELPFPSALLPLMDQTRYKRIGVEVGWVGFPNLAPDQLCFFSGKISSFLNQEDCYLIDGVAVHGVSGGPVFSELNDETPEIIGTVSAYVPNLRPSDTLPGLLRAQDVAPFQEHIQQIQSLDDARKKKSETPKEIEEQNGGTPELTE